MKPELPLDVSYLKNSVNRRRQSCSLFVEFANPEAPLTFARKDTDTAWSLPALYLDLALGDATEYTFATEVFGSHSFWNHLLSVKTLEEYIQEMRHEVAIKRQSMLQNKLWSEATTDSPRCVSAASLLIKQNFDLGLPSKVKKATSRTDQAQAAQDAQDLKGIADDLKRMTAAGHIN